MWARPQAEQLCCQETGSSRVALWIASEPWNRIPLWEVIYFNHILIHTHTYTLRPHLTLKYDLFILNLLHGDLQSIPPPPPEALSCSMGESVGIRPWFMIYWFLGEGVGNAEWGKAVGSFDPSNKSHRLSQTSEESILTRKAVPCVTTAHPRGRSGLLLMANEHARWESVLLPFILGPY